MYCLQGEEPLAYTPDRGEVEWERYCYFSERLSDPPIVAKAEALVCKEDKKRFPSVLGKRTSEEVEGDRSDGGSGGRHPRTRVPNRSPPKDEDWENLFGELASLNGGDFAEGELETLVYLLALIGTCVLRRPRYERI